MSESNREPSATSKTAGGATAPPSGQQAPSPARRACRPTGTTRDRAGRSARGARASRRSGSASGARPTPRSNGRGGTTVGFASPPFEEVHERALLAGDVPARAPGRPGSRPGRRPPRPVRRPRRHGLQSARSGSLDRDDRLACASSAAAASIRPSSTRCGDRVEQHLVLAARGLTFGAVRHDDPGPAPVGHGRAAWSRSGSPAPPRPRSPARCGRVDEVVGAQHGQRPVELEVLARASTPSPSVQAPEHAAASPVGPAVQARACTRRRRARSSAAPCVGASGVSTLAGVPARRAQFGASGPTSSQPASASGTRTVATSAATRTRVCCSHWAPMRSHTATIDRRRAARPRRAAPIPRGCRCRCRTRGRARRATTRTPTSAGTATP